MSVQHTDRNRRSWTMCPLLRIRGSAPIQETRRGAETATSACAMANGFANETVRDRGDDARHRRRSTRPFTWSARRGGTPETVGDMRRMAHNPEVGGSNPPPATKARDRIRTRIRSIPFVPAQRHPAPCSAAAWCQPCAPAVDARSIRCLMLICFYAHHN